MNTNWICRLVVPGLLLASSATTQANDIVDFFKAINRAERHHNAPPAFQPVDQHDDHGHEGPGHEYGDRNLTSRDLHKIQMANRPIGYGDPRSDRFNDRFTGHPAHSDDRVSLRDHNYGQPAYTRPSGARISFRISSNGGMNPGYGAPSYYSTGQEYQELPPVQEMAPAPAYPVVPVYPSVQQSPPVIATPHQIGEIVTCRVPLARCVRVEDARNIAPDAIPVIVAVRDPNMCAHDTVERVVFVQVFVPPCPMSGIRVSPCRTRVTMCFHQYEVDIKSKNGMIVVDYDN